MVILRRSGSPRQGSRVLFASIFLLVLACLPLSRPATPTHAQAEGRLYPETGYTLASEFVAFYDKHGGVPLFGYPVTEARTENGYLVQWTERQRLEWHPENAGTDFEVLLGLLGRELTHGLDGPRFQAAELMGAAAAGLTSTTDPEGHLFPETGQIVDEPFYSYWLEHGGLAVFGYPISVLYSSNGLQTQWFERARFEIHPENPPETRVLLGHLGYEALKEREVTQYKFEVFGNVAPESKLEIGLSQGGESDDPGFFDNIKDTGAALGPGLVRLDNIYNFYDIVGRAADGTITYNWSHFDRVLDGVTAMGKEPLICLSYMPEVMSVNGASRVKPPLKYDEWSALVKATVTHVNIDRKLGVRYWEVWNEPDQWSFWQAPFPEYLKLYDITVEAALAADPTVKLGGPSVAHFSTDHLGEFLEHEQWQGVKGRVDFISWHSYGHSPDEIAANIRTMRKILERFPQFSPEIFITEFNVLQGGAGDTSAGGYTDTAEGAIAFLSSIESMQRERLDRAFLFELKDGQGPKSYWGRWGILTNDGLPKPIYYALKAYQNRPPGMLPVALRSGPTDGSLGMLAYGGPTNSTIMLWYTGSDDARIKIVLPQTFQDTDFDIALFDKKNNNPAATGDSILNLMGPRNARDILLDLTPNSLVIMTSR
ncbi:MAG: glycosyl hydrolase [Chloroflexota bacterium]